MSGRFIRNTLSIAGIVGITGSSLLLVARMDSLLAWERRKIYDFIERDKNTRGKNSRDKKVTDNIFYINDDGSESRSRHRD